MPYIKWKEITSGKPLSIPAEKLQTYERRILGIRKFGTEVSFKTSKDIEFSRLFRFYLRTTDEKAVDCNLIEKGVLKSEDLKRRKKFLDVGVGEGVLAAKLLPNFEKSLLIDREESIARFARQYLFNKFKGKKSAHQIETGKLSKTGLSCVPDGETYDLVLLSHMLYFHKTEDWTAIAKAAYRLVTPGGAMAIIVHGDEGQVAELIKKSGGKNDDINEFAFGCKRDYGWNASFYKAQTRHQAYSAAGLGALMNFFAMDTGAKEITSLEAYRAQSGIYEITKYDKMIVVFKPGERGGSDYNQVDAEKPSNRRRNILHGQN